MTIPWPENTFMSKLGLAEATALFSTGTDQEFSGSSELSVQGEPASSVLVLVEGHVKSVREARTGSSSAVIGISGPGDLLGVESAFLHGTWNASHIALRTVRVRAVRASRLLALAEQDPRISTVVNWALATQLRLRDAALAYSTHGVPVRLVALLKKLDERYGVPSEDGRELDIGLTHGDLAAAIGASTPAVSTCLRDLAERHVVRTSHRKITFLRPLQLAA
ncbi:Crp/Fnr family transcriptional regulator [Umezawaea beigongshangensis]|uniref:Crp/Fnr family transcriptional regulator n=1 Tax=Umezawaea beigongshangensis TaxID=2780383 RepID=UPI0018F17644|nr:Crp/Fnr family transcriptional regulator [Umezawaea beigongshangensis]